MNATMTFFINKNKILLSLFYFYESNLTKQKKNYLFPVVKGSPSKCEYESNSIGIQERELNDNSTNNFSLRSIQYRKNLCLQQLLVFQFRDLFAIKRILFEQN